MVAIVPNYLMELYERRCMTGNLYSINHFKVEWTHNDYPRYEGYIIDDDEWIIAINQYTQFTYLEPGVENSFPIYPMVASIESLVRIIISED